MGLLGQQPGFRDPVWPWRRKQGGDRADLWRLACELDGGGSAGVRWKGHEDLQGVRMEGSPGEKACSGGTERGPRWGSFLILVASEV